jgi:23S rRNA pseudouridine1911/1915/1917 synthase
MKLAVAGPARRVDRLLADEVAGLSRSAAARLIRAGDVLLNGHPARVADQAREGDVVEFDLPSSDAAVELPAPESIPLDVVYEDPQLVVVDKPAGMVVHPAAGHRTATLVHALLGLGGTWSAASGELRPGIVHRLDRDTSGLIAAARTDAAHRSLAAQLADRTMYRTYLAIVRGAVKEPAGTLEGAIGRHPRDRKRMAVVARGRHSKTHFEVKERLHGCTLLRCRLETGRTHQIRVHLAAFGHPVAGDRVYGGGTEPGRPMLHAWQLRFRHPVDGREMQFEAPPPADFLAFLEALR